MTVLSISNVSTLFFTTLLATLLLATPQTSQATTDSVGVFYKADKVVILVNEDRGAPRLQAFFDELDARGLLAESPPSKDRYVFLSEDQTARIQCARSQATATCTFRFLPSPMAAIADRRIEAFIPSSALAKTPAPSRVEFQMKFASSMKDLFVLKLSDDGIHIEGQKRSVESSQTR